MKEYPTFLGLRKSAWLEILAFFAAALVIDFLLLKSGTRFIGIEPHPFWIIVLLVATQYGTNEGLIAALLASAALLIGNMPPHDIDQDNYSYLLSVARLPLLWIVSAVVLGEIRQRHVRERDRLIDEITAAQERGETIAAAYARLKELKENLELRVAGQLRSTIEAYRAAKEMEKLNPIDVLSGVQRLVTSIINPEKFSIYLINGNALESTVNHGWMEGDSYPTLIESSTPIYNAVIGRQQLLCVANSDQERILGSQGVLAGPLVDPETGEVLGMLKVEKLGFLDLNLSTIETFRTLCEWIGLTLVNARRYQTAKSESLVNPDHNLMSYSYFQHYSDYTTSLAKRVGFDVSMLMVKLTGTAELGDNQRRQAAILLSEAVHKTLRAVDLAFDYQTSGAEYAVVLPATNTSGARIVLDKITKEVNDRLRRGNIPGVGFSFTVSSLHTVQRNAG